MQTFLPYADFRKTAKVLDYRRLGKQRVETYQILKILSGQSKTKGWINHPAVLMWKGFECALLDYQKAICEEWMSREYSDTCLEKSIKIHNHRCPENIIYPNWIGNSDFHNSHKSNLLRKDISYYGKFFNVSPDDPYLWPTKI